MSLFTQILLQLAAIAVTLVGVTVWFRRHDIGAWFRDKWAWLKTFNKRPKVEVNATVIIGKPESHVLYLNSRVDVDFTTDVLDSPKPGMWVRKGTSVEMWDYEMVMFCVQAQITGTMYPDLFIPGAYPVSITGVRFWIYLSDDKSQPKVQVSHGKDVMDVGDVLCKCGDEIWIMKESDFRKWYRQL